MSVPMLNSMPGRHFCPLPGPDVSAGLLALGVLVLKLDVEVALALELDVEVVLELEVDLLSVLEVDLSVLVAA